MPLVSACAAPCGGRDQDVAATPSTAASIDPTPEQAPAYRKVSPDGSIRVDLDSKEWGNSYWVNSPRVIETATGRVVLDLWETDWDADISFPADRRVHIFFRRYHRGGTLAASWRRAKRPVRARC